MRFDSTDSPSDCFRSKQDTKSQFPCDNPGYPAAPSIHFIRLSDNGILPVCTREVAGVCWKIPNRETGLSVNSQYLFQSARDAPISPMGRCRHAAPAFSCFVRASQWSGDDCGLLLSHAVKCSESPYQIQCVDADNCSIRITVLQQLQSTVVVRITKCGNNHCTTG